MRGGDRSGRRGGAPEVDVRLGVDPAGSPARPRPRSARPWKSNGAWCQVPRSTARNSSVRAYRIVLRAVSPKRACSLGSPPVTMLSISRPPEIRWYAAAICAASTGLITPGRKATRNFSRGSRAAARRWSARRPRRTCPSASRSPVNPAARRSGRRRPGSRSSAAGSPASSVSRRPVGTSRGRPGPAPTRDRLSPEVGRNQCSFTVIACPLHSPVRGVVELVGEEVGDVELARAAGRSSANASAISCSESMTVGVDRDDLDLALGHARPA